MSKLSRHWNNLRASFWFLPALIVSFSTILALALVDVDSSGRKDWMDDWPRLFGASAAGSRGMLATIAGAMTTVVGVFPSNTGRGPVGGKAATALPPPPSLKWQTILSSRDGYLQSVDYKALMKLAREHKTIVRMEFGIGGFVVEKTPLASLTLQNPPNQKIIASLRSAFNIDRFRTVKQDCGFGIRQLVDMALRALSPGINDTTTAVMCVDHLSAILARLAAREIPSTHRYEDGELRLIAIGQSFDILVAESFDEIRGSAAGNIAIMLRMLGALQTIAGFTDKPCRRQVLQDHAEWIAELAARSIESSRDMARFEKQFARLNEVLWPSVQLD